MNGLLTRIISALIAIAVVFALYSLWQEIGLLVVVVLATFGAALEFTFLSFKSEKKHGWVAVLFLVLCMLNFVSMIWLEAALPVVLGLSVVIFCSLLFFALKTDEDLNQVLRWQAMASLGFVYCGVFPALLGKVLLSTDGVKWFLLYLCIIFSTDTFAYFAGLLFGKKKLFPILSPKKTIAGSVGGLLGAVFVGWILGQWLFPEIAWSTWVLMSFVIGCFGQVGDLFESQMKRVAQVKDSGAVLPGHGGVLDRIDAVLFAAPVFYLFLFLGF